MFEIQIIGFVHSKMSILSFTPFTSCHSKHKIFFHLFIQLISICYLASLVPHLKVFSPKTLTILLNRWKVWTTWFNPNLLERHWHFIWWMEAAWNEPHWLSRIKQACLSFCWQIYTLWTIVWSSEFTCFFVFFFVFFTTHCSSYKVIMLSEGLN